MKDETINEPLYKYIQDEINKAEKKSDKFRAFFYTSRVIQILLASAVTIMAGISEKGEKNEWLLYLGAAITIIAGLETLFQFELKSSTYKLILYELREIRTEIIHLLLKKDRLDASDLDNFFQKYRSIKGSARQMILKERQFRNPGSASTTT
ncbi:MAG TPA: SLATT domain-containing protein [Chitinophagaceae bacterium]|nr:SLATT domain-containing protein [Chitinophagaceae bacterium]